jgi:hypothetical protein
LLESRTHDLPIRHWKEDSGGGRREGEGGLELLREMKRKRRRRGGGFYRIPQKFTAASLDVHYRGLLRALARHRHHVIGRSQLPVLQLQLQLQIQLQIQIQIQIQLRGDGVLRVAGWQGGCVRA